MAITNEQLQEKLMDMLRVLESADPATKQLDEFKTLRTALTKAEQKLDQVGPPPVLR